MKYINFEIAGFVVFDNSINHDDMAKKFPHDIVLSAGTFVLTCEDEQVGMYGESLTLNVSSNESDACMFYRRACIY